MAITVVVLCGIETRWPLCSSALSAGFSIATPSKARMPAGVSFFFSILFNKQREMMKKKMK
jgi:hypothetical protein